MTKYVVEEIDREFVLPIAGFVCSESRPGPYTDRSELILRTIDSKDEAWVWGTHVGEDLIRHLVGCEARVEGALATRDSTLRIDFENGVSVVNPPADRYEGWEVRGPGYVLAIARPRRREPAIWDETSEIRTVLPGDPLPRGLVKAIKGFGLPMPTGEFELRCSNGRPQSFELHPPNAPRVNRNEVVQLMA